MHPFNRSLGLTLLLASAAPALAGEARRHFDIPPQPLTSALQELAAQAGVQVFSVDANTAGKKSQPLSGHLTTREAIDRLLAGSGLTASLTEDGTVAVKVAEAKPEARSKPEGKQEPEVYQLPEMTVTADPRQLEQSYNAYSASTATKTDTPIMETPVSIAVVPRQLLDDQQAIRISDGLKNYSGVNSGYSFRAAGGNEAFVLRGFNTEFQTNGALSYREGVRLQGFPQPTASLERVEFLKGPAAILYAAPSQGALSTSSPKTPYQPLTIRSSSSLAPTTSIAPAWTRRVPSQRMTPCFTG